MTTVGISFSTAPRDCKYRNEVEIKVKSDMRIVITTTTGYHRTLTERALGGRSEFDSVTR